MTDYQKTEIWTKEVKLQHDLMLTMITSSLTYFQGLCKETGLSIHEITPELINKTFTGEK